MPRQTIEQALTTWEEKLATYECELSSSTNPSLKFELRKGIQECQEEIERIKQRINLSEQDRNLDYLDSSSEPEFDEKTVELRLPRLYTPFQVPPLPSYFVARPEVSRDLKNRLLEKNETNGTLVISAIHGFGGIGKSTLVAALAHEIDVINRFPDGIFWATLGQEPDVLSLLTSWVQALGDHDFRPTNIDAASRHLCSLFHNKAALLVVDDVWNVDHALPFRIGDSECRVLITTRNADIARVVDATLYSLDVMTEEQALALLEGRIKRNFKDLERNQAKSLAETVECLPLALELAAAQVADGILWSELLSDLQAEIARLDTLDLPGAEDATDEITRKKLSLLASFNLSLRRLSEEKLQRFAWLGVVPEDVNLTQGMVTTLWETDERTARDSLRYLRDKALLLEGVPLADGTHTYRLHDLLHDLSRHLLTSPPKPKRKDDLPGLGLTLPQAHAVMLERYRKLTGDRLWHQIPDDGYIHAYLTWHMEKAGWEDELHALLKEETHEGQNGWYQVRDRLSQTAGYLADVTRAWKVAEQAFAENQSTSAIGFQVRYALITASLNSIASNIPPDLLEALVEKKIWTAEQGLVYARQKPDLVQKSLALAIIAPNLPIKEIGKIYQESLITLQEDKKYNYGYSAALSNLEKIILNGYTKILKIVVSDFHESLLQEILEIVKRFTEESEFIGFLMLMPYLSSAQSKMATEYLLSRYQELLDQDFKYFSEQIQFPKNFKAEFSSTKKLVEKTAPYISSEIEQVLLFYIDNQRFSQRIYQSLENLLHPHVSNSVLEEVKTILSDVDTYQPLRSSYQDLERLISPHVPTSVLEEAQTILLAAENNLFLIQLSHDRELRSAESRYERDSDRSGRSEFGVRSWKYKILQKFKKPTSNHQRQELNSYDQVYLQLHQDLENLLSPYVSILVLEEVYTMLLDVDNNYNFRDLINSLENLLTTNLLELMLNEIREIILTLKPVFSPVWQDYLLDLKQCLTGSQIEKMPIENTITKSLMTKNEIQLKAALIEARLLQDRDDRVSFLVTLAVHLSESLIEEILVTIQMVQKEDKQAELFSSLIPHLSEKLLSRMLTLLEEIKNENNRVAVLITLISRLSDLQHLESALVIARKLKEEGLRAKIFVNLIPHLPSPLQDTVFKEALTTMQLQCDTQWQIEREKCVKENIRVQDSKELLIKTIINLADPISEPLKEKLFQEASNIAKIIEDVTARKIAIRLLIPYLTMQQLEELIPIARTLEDESLLAAIIVKLAPIASESLLKEGLEAAKGIVSRITNTKPLIGNQESEAHQQKSRILVELAPYLQNSLLEEALATARDIKYIESKTYAIAALACYLPESQREIVFKEEVFKLLITQIMNRREYSPENSTLDQQEKYFRKEVLKKIAPHIPSRLLEDTFTILNSSGELYFQLKITFILVSCLPESQQEDILLSKIQKMYSSFNIPAIEIVDLKSSLPEAQFSKLRGVWSETAKRNWNLFVEYKMESQAIDTILLIPYLSDILEDVLKETLIVTRKMNGKNRTTLLNFLGIYLSELSHDTLFPLWCDTLHFLAHRTRKDLFEDLQALTPVIISLGGVEAVEEMASAIQDIGRWWP